MFRHLRQKLPPEGHRLLHEPLRKIDEGHESVVDHHPVRPQPPGHGNGLTIAQPGRVTHQRIDGAGMQLGKGRVEPQAPDARRLPFRGGDGLRILQHHRLTKGGDLKAQTAAAGRLRGGAVDAGQMQFSLQRGALHRQPSLFSQMGLIIASFPQESNRRNAPHGHAVRGVRGVSFYASFLSPSESPDRLRPHGAAFSC